MNNSIVTIEKVKEEQFNSYDFSVDTIQKYMAYYMLLLTVACDIGIISETEKERINQTLLIAIAGKVKGKAILVANVIYVYTYWLLSKKPSEALEELRHIVTAADAEESLEKAKKFFKTFISRNRVLLLSVKNKVMKNENEAIANSYNQLQDLLAECENFDESEDVVFKTMHTVALPCVYLPLKKPKRESYFQQLGDFIKIFTTEMGIMAKLNGADFFKNLNTQANINEANYSKELQELEDKYNAELKKLKEEYEKLEKDAREREENPANNRIYLSPKEIRDTYLRKKDNLLQSWDKAEKSLLKKQGLEDSVDLVSAELNLPSLAWLIKEFALYTQAQAGTIKYPQIAKAKAKAIDGMTDETAISEVLKFKDVIALTESEAKYLEACI